VPPGEYQPFDAQTVLRTSYVDDCLQWPPDAVRPPNTGPLPDVPALLLGGRLDTRTPVENALALAKELPHSSVVTLRGSGHDVLDSDVTGCSARALTRFILGTPVGTPCADKDNGVSPIPLPPRALSDFRRAPGVAGDRGRALFGVLDTAIDARLSALQALFAGVNVRGGGLRGGSYSGAAALEGDVRLRRYAYVPGLRVTGTLKTSTGRISGTLRVEGKGVTGRLTLDRRGGARGVLGGRAVRYEPPARTTAANASLRADGARAPLVLDARHRRLPVVR
jgi:TAP-like protein